MCVCVCYCRDHGSRTRQFKDEIASMDVDDSLKEGRLLVSESGIC